MQQTAVQKHVGDQCERRRNRAIQPNDLAGKARRNKAGCQHKRLIKAGAHDKRQKLQAYAQQQDTPCGIGGWRLEGLHLRFPRFGYLNSTCSMR